jgi:hypothetical protein
MARISGFVLATSILGCLAAPIANAEVLTLGAGTESCATWQANEASLDQGNNWIEGYWTGLNEGADQTTGKKTDAAGILGAVALLCQSNPTKTIIDAATSVWSDMSLTDQGIAIPQ